MMMFKFLFNPLLVLLLILGVLGLMGWMIYMLSEWKDHRSECHVSLKFDEFVRMYNIAPDKYHCAKDEVRYGSWASGSRICFSYMDYIRYRSWLKREEKEELNRKNLRIKREYLEKVQHDIDAYREAAKKEIEEMGEKLRG